MKRGMILLKEVMYLLLAIAVIAIILIAGSKVYSMVSASQEGAQAQGTIENFITFLKNIPSGQMDKTLLYAPSGYWFVSYTKDEQKPASECYGKDCICICKTEGCDSDSYCAAVDKPVGSNKIAIRLTELRVTNNGNDYSIAETIKDVLNEGEVTVESDKCYGKPVSLVRLGDACRLGTNPNDKCALESIVPIYEKAQAYAKSIGITDLQVTSGYRTIAMQTALWNENPNPQFVCPPGNKCPHLTGCALDVCFGELCDKGLSPYLSNENTTLLEEIMFSAGFVRYKNEYWHFEYGTDRWQTCTNEKVNVC